MTIAKLGKIYDQMRNSGIPLLPFNYIGLVKRNDDAQRMGRLSVWIPEMGGDPDDEGGWVIASYASPFAGATDLTRINGYTTNSNVAQQAYGLWLIPPDLNNEVVIFFANGDISRAYWFACTWQQNMNHMIPGIAVNVTTEPSPPIHVSPVIEYNKADKNIDIDAPRRPPFQSLTDGLYTEGLDRDNERGTSSTSARREAPSKTFGLLSPRGNTIHIDDNEENEFIRLRTRSGAQVLIDETTGFVYINSKNGNAWLEISDAGIDAYSANGISMRAQGDINIRADRNIFFDADQDISFHAGQNITMEAGKDAQVKIAHDLFLSAGNDIQAGCGNNLVLSATQQATIKTGDEFNVNSGTRIHLESSANTHIKSGSNLRLQSTSDTTLKAGGRQTRDGTTILDNTGASPAADAATASNATAPTTPAATSKLDTTPRLNGTSSTRDGAGRWQWNHSGGTISMVGNRMPTHEPWKDHPRSNVPPPPLEDVPINYQPTYGGQTEDNTEAVAGTQVNDSGCSFGVANTKPVSTEVFNAIKAAADKTGADPATMLAFADMESGFNPNARAKTSSASGLFQFTGDTWKGMVTQYGNRYNVSYDGINDAPSNAMMGGQFIKDNSDRLQKNGLASNPGNLYIMHFMGSGGGPTFIKAAQSNPSQDASLAFPAAANANPGIFRKGRTLGEVYTSLTTNANSKANAYAGQLGTQAPCIRPTGTAASPAPGSGGTSAGSNTLLPSNFEQYKGQQVGNGECVTLVQVVGHLPRTTEWKPGDPPSGNTPIGTPIASFQNGHYIGHAGFFNGMLPDGSGFTMIDQYNSPKTNVGVRTYSYSRSGIQNAGIYRVIHL